MEYNISGQESKRTAEGFTYRSEYNHVPFLSIQYAISD